MAMNPFLPISFWSAWRKAKWLEQFTTLPEPINLFKPVGREFESRPTHQLYKSHLRVAFSFGNDCFEHVDKIEVMFS